MSNAVERGMKGAHFEFRKERLGFKKGYGQRASLIPQKTNCNLNQISVNPCI